MQVRHGKCSSCEKQYRLPASFAHDRARCKECGGVVEIGPAEDLDQPAAPAKPSAEAPPAKPMPARRPAAKPAAKPTPAPAPEPEPKAEEAEQEEAAPARPARVERKSRTGARSGGRSRAGSRSKRGGRSRGRDEEEAEETGIGRRTRAGRAAGRGQKKSMTPIWITVAGVLVIVIGVVIFMSQGGDEPAPNPTDEVAAAEPAEDAAAEASEAASDEETAEPAGDEPADEAPAEEPAAEEPAAGEAAAEGDAEPEAPAKPEKRYDPSTLDLAGIPDFGPAPGTSDEEWIALQADATLMFEDDGIRGSRATDRVKDAGRKAVPAIINQMKRLDYGLKASVEMGDIAQKALEEICNGINFTWRYTTSDQDHLFNKKVVRAWADKWAEVENDVDAWAKLVKLTPEETAALKAELGVESTPADTGGDDDFGDDFGDDF
jgi:hypothetical protein